MKKEEIAKRMAQTKEVAKDLEKEYLLFAEEAEREIQEIRKKVEQKRIEMKKLDDKSFEEYLKLAAAFKDAKKEK